MKKHWSKKAFIDYCFNEKKLATIAHEKKKDISTVRRNLDRLQFCRDFQRTSDNHINLVFDGVYFGRSLCYIVCRAENKTIYFRECPETIGNIGTMLDDLESMGYVFKSFTVDGRKGVKKYLKWRYPNVPLKHCMFHQVAAITRYITGSPKTECGRELKALSGVLWKTNRTDFEARFKALKHRYADFLKERNENKQFKHRRLRSAFRSIDRNMPDLFTWQENPGLNIPNTTNTCEGYFRQIKTRLRVHSGLKRERLKKVIERLFIGR